MVSVRVRGVVGSGERFFQDLQKEARRSESVDLELPSTVRGDAFGGVAAVMQLTATWATRFRHNSRIRTFVSGDSSDKELLALLGSRPHLLFASLLGVGMLARDGHTDLSARLERTARKVLAAARNEVADTRPVRGGAFSTLISDGHDNIAPKWLYIDGAISRGLIPPDERYHPLADRVLASQKLEGGYELDAESVSSLSWAMYELFVNTHQWATNRPIPDSDGRARFEKLRYSVRGIYAQRHQIARSTLKQHVGENELVAHYLGQIGDSETIDLVELSVIDTGFGITRRRAFEQFGSRSYSHAEEVIALRWALARQRTESFDHLKGIGFHRALLALTHLKGLLWVRSGHVSAIRNLIDQPYPSEQELESFRLDDRDHGWTDIDDAIGLTQSPFSIAAADSVGTRVTLLFPAESVSRRK